MNAITPVSHVPVSKSSADMAKASLDLAGIGAGTATYWWLTPVLMTKIVGGLGALATAVTGSWLPAAGIAAATAADAASGVPLVRLGLAVASGFLAKKSVEAAINMGRAGIEVAQRTGSVVKDAADKVQEVAVKIGDAVTTSRPISTPAYAHNSFGGAQPAA